ncbi:hypothetical protein [Lactobacillus sp.]|uniref:hypothetical protein n=1 Tax=Lactobacillus sp. TaxID=1591 RepID=UPI0019C93D16|nr:hypothetical protein [Lactobacillus sp.]MBD5430734.1 hypothetical protein [Lactobacillus sp.]
MNLNDINFTEKDVQDFMEELDIDAILENINNMPADNESEFSYSHNTNFYFAKNIVNDEYKTYDLNVKENNFILSESDGELIA